MKTMNRRHSYGKPPAQLGMRSLSAPDRPAHWLPGNSLSRACRLCSIDAKQFPREKVCGGYLNSRAIKILQQAGLAHITVDGLLPL